MLSQIKVKKGQTASVGDVVALIEEGAAAAAKPKAAEAPKAEPPKAAPAAEQEERPKSVRPTIPPQGFARVMPSARRALKERGLSPDDVEATGPGGRVLKEDVDRLKEKPAAKAPATDRQEEVVAMSPFRKRIAERLVQSQQTAALLTTFNEVDMGAVRSTVTLSVSIFAITSSRATASPSPFSHSPICTSVIDSPTLGTFNSIAMLC